VRGGMGMGRGWGWEGGGNGVKTNTRPSICVAADRPGVHLLLQRLQNHRLNLGLAAVEVVYSSVFGASLAAGLAAGDGPAASNLVGSVGIAAYCLFQYATATKDKEG